MLIGDMILANKGDIAETVLLPGDPLRAKHFAENYLEDAKCYNTNRGLFGYTGLYEGFPVSIQASGMGTSSIVECVYQLVENFGCKTLIRVGSCASNHPDVHVGDIILSTACANESNCVSMDFGEYDFVPTGDFDLIKAAYDSATNQNIPIHVGVTGCCDLLYRELDQLPLVGSEMEGTGLFATVSRFEDVRAMLIMTCGTHKVYHDEKPAVDRSQDVYSDMFKISLDAASKVQGVK